MVLSHPWDMELFSFNSSEQPEFNSSFENPSSRYPIDLSCPSISVAFSPIHLFHRLTVAVEGPSQIWACSELSFTENSAFEFH
jgi:hypothetical protein